MKFRDGPLFVLQEGFMAMLQDNPDYERVRSQSVRAIVNTLFFYKNLFYKKVEAEIDPDFKNILRTYPS